jgi:CRP-like cAMP-binding protein
MSDTEDKSRLGYGCTDGDRSCEIYSDYNVLKQLPAFEGVTPEIIKLWAYFGRRTVYEPGEIMLRRGEPIGRAHCVVSGSAKVFFDKNGQEFFIHTLKEMDVFGELALLADITSMVHIQAIDTVVTFSFDKKSFWKVYAQFPRHTKRAVEQIVKLRISWQQEVMKRHIEEAKNPERVAVLAKGLFI